MFVKFKKITSSGPNGSVKGILVPASADAAVNSIELGTIDSYTYTWVKNGVEFSVEDGVTVIPIYDLNLIKQLFPTVEDLITESEREQALQLAKHERLKLIDAEASKFEENENKDMYFTSSVNGWKFNGDRRSKSNMEDLIEFSDSDVIVYRDYDNIFRELTKEQLRITLKEHVLNGQNLYAQKWEFQNRINSAASIDELNALDLTFVMLDFTQN